nr:T9SS type A sorting domain-containing protein [Bacteroidota bacterium]
KIPFGAKYFEIGNIDDDPYNEVVYSNGRIIQVQNSSIINEYQFQTSNGNVRIGLSDMNADDVKDVVYSSSDTIYVYDFEAKQLIWSQKWESDYGYDKPITGMWFYDYDGDNTKDVFIGNSSRDAVYCYNGVNGNKDFNLADSPIDGIINVAVADLDSDTNLEIIWSTGAYNTGPDYFFVYDLSTLGEDWQSRHYKSDFKAFDVGDVDNDGQLEIVSGCFGEYLQYYDHGFLTVFDAETKNIKWRNDTEIFGNQVEDYTDIKIGDIDNDGKNELLLGVEYDYAFTYVYVFDSIYEVERSFEIHGMSIILDMAIVDIDSDGENELMVTSGTNVSGSSNPDDWQNYIYIFDGASGEIEWQSELLAGVGSTNSLLNIGNIDSDEAFEIVTMLDKRDENFHTLIIVDGTSHEIIQDNSMNYTAVSISDFDNDGKYDILAAVDNGTIEILDGTTLSSKQTINIPCGKINTINTYDLNSDNVMELIFTDNYTLNLFDIANNETKWRSDTINSRVGCFNSLKIGNIDADDKIEILLNANHGIFTFKVNYDSISSVFPVTNYSNQNASRIYPNPTRNKLTIETNIDTPDLFHFKIFDLFGCIVQEEFYSNIYNGNNTTEIDVSDLKPGVYTILLIKDEKILSSNKIIKIP